MARSIIVLLLFVCLAGCIQSNITITGNIDKELYIDASGNLKDILENAKIKAEYILVIATDGTAFFISERSFGELKLIKKKGSFHSVAATLPPVCNLNDIIEICVYVSDHKKQDQNKSFSERIADFEFLGENSKNGHIVRKYRSRSE